MTDKTEHNITSTIEDYLETILVLSEKKDYAKVTEIAEFHNISKASVTEMIAKLKKMGFVNSEKYGTISLTPKGKEIAQKVKNKHEILLVFLLLIGVKPENANLDCCVMEHNLTKETIEKLGLFINFLQTEEQKDILERFRKFMKEQSK
ncbi:MAG: metal-dependent transcriptional regulator [Candidatus Heimdallarchaeota archaeon]|nr:MAG: metal-dependent transcriptional regulator [Candidatus Gerdarchaeota archaeon]RLI74194.1 MAG: metal-dependent transcriptional regulator [Candidatus Heimdallarchaeota archaeon]